MPGLAVTERESTREILTAPIPLLNHSLDFLPEEVFELWTDGVPMPDQEHGRMDPDRIRRSVDGQWVVRRDRHKGSFRSRDHLVAWAAGQFEDLQELGLSIISRGITPYASLDEEMVFIITPWLEDRRNCPDNIFYSHIAPIINQYLAGAAAGSLVLADLREPHQYSKLEKTSEVLLHDLDLIIHRANSESTRPISLR